MRMTRGPIAAAAETSRDFIHRTIQPDLNVAGSGYVKRGRLAAIALPRRASFVISGIALTSSQPMIMSHDTD